MAALTESDVATFARYKLEHDFLVTHGVARVTNAEARDLLGPIRDDGDMAGIAFHYFDPSTNGDRRRWGVRIRRDHPGVRSGNKPSAKYINAMGSHHLYFPFGCGQSLSDINIPLVLVEAEKSALAGTAWSERNRVPLLFIATGGVHGWQGRVTKERDPKGNLLDVKGPLRDLDLIKFEARRVIVLFDANATTNHSVWCARYKFAEELTSRGAFVQLGNVPSLDGKINGPDDLLAACGDDAFSMLLDTAEPFAKAAVAEANAFVADLEEHADTRVDLDALVTVLSTVADSVQRELLIGRVAKVFNKLIPKATIRDAVEKKLEKRRSSRDVVAEAVRQASLQRKQINPAELITRLETYFTERAYLPRGAALALAFWALHTWTFDLFDTVPYLTLESPVPGCGKTTVVGLLRICARPLSAVAVTAATLYRLVHEMKPTLLIDEAETINSSTDRAIDVRQIAQSGYKKGGKVPRCQGEDNKVEWYETYCPKLFALVGGLSGALLQRCIVIPMEHRPCSAQRKSCRERVLKRDTKPLIEMMEAYALKQSEALSDLYEKEPDEGYWPDILDREAEIWGPLLIHARLAGEVVERRLLEAVESLSMAKARTQANDSDIALASELLDALIAHKMERFSAIDLLPALGESWAAKLSRCKDDTARAASVGRFVKRFRVASTKSHGRLTYDTSEVASHIRANVPLKSSPDLPSSPGLLFSSSCAGEDLRIEPPRTEIDPPPEPGPRTCHVHGIHPDWYCHPDGKTFVCSLCHPREDQ